MPQDESDLVELQRHALLVEVLLHIHVEELEDKSQFVLSMDDLLKLDDAWVVQLPKESNFSESCAWNAFVTVFNFDSFDCNNL